MKKAIKKALVLPVLATTLSVSATLPSLPVLSNVLEPTITSVSAAVVYTYYPKCSSSYTSLVDALKSIGVDSSYSNRKTIAAKNGISNYSGTSSQNTTLLNKLKAGTLIKSSTTVADTTYYPKCSSSYTSLVDALKSIGVDSSYSNRQAIAAKNGINNYTGTSSQNTALLNKLKAGTLIKATSTSSSSESTSSGSSQSSSGLVVNSSYSMTSTSRNKNVTPHYMNYEGKRSATNYNTVINQFDVANNPRYARTPSYTWCNIFGWDVMSAMGLDSSFSHWYKNDVPVTYANRSGANEYNANATYNWLKKHGYKYGWSQVSMSLAQQRANAGYPTLAVWYNTSGGSGHIMVVRPETSSYKCSSSKGCVIAQAGSSNFNIGYVVNGVGSSKLSSVLYFTHN